MNTLDYIHNVFQNALDYCNKKETMSSEDCKSLLLHVSCKIDEQIKNNFLKVCMDILDNNPHLANRHCCGNYILPNDKVEIKFTDKL